MKGVYVLVISVNKNVKIEISTLGTKFFRKGLFAYIGSAQTNLEKRVRRHLKKRKKKFWHIDYLLDNDLVEIVEVFYKNAAKIEECNIASKTSDRGFPVNGFGSSDCKCKSHLFELHDFSFFENFMHKLQLKFISDL